MVSLVIPVPSIAIQIYSPHTIFWEPWKQFCSYHFLAQKPLENPRTHDGLESPACYGPPTPIQSHSLTHWGPASCISLLFPHKTKIWQALHLALSLFGTLFHQTELGSLLLPLRICSNVFLWEDFADTSSRSTSLTPLPWPLLPSWLNSTLQVCLLSDPLSLSQQLGWAFLFNFCIQKIVWPWGITISSINISQLKSKINNREIDFWFMWLFILSALGKPVNLLTGV